MKSRLLAKILTGILTLASHSALALDGPTPVRNFGPTGLEIDLQKNNTLKVTGVLPGSPADGKFNKGQIIERINGSAIPEGFWEYRHHLGDLISRAEATDGKLVFSTDQGEITLTLPVLGAFSDTWPLDCPKTAKIIDANAAWLRGLAQSGKGLTAHSMVDGLGILSLLSTGEEQDLDVVRGIYQKKMASFKPETAGPHSWHNGYQGIAVCEYYLRTGDKSVIPLINAIAEAARRYQVHGGYYHWATAANPKYGVVNATGTNMLTFMLLAKHCGAEVNEQSLRDSLHFFYRFVGHGNNPYGDGRPESGTGGNGKTEQIAAAMRIAALSDHPDAYVMAANKGAQNPLYTYRAMLNGHTGPIGPIWYSAVAAQALDLKPALYRNRQDEVRWFYELSRLHDGSFVMSSCRGYDNTEYGRSMLLGLTAPRKTLRITGAPRSQFGTAFSLPDLPWGRPADLAFFSLEGSPSYKPLDPVPHVEFEKIPAASKEQLRHAAGHPEQSFREAVATAIRNGGHHDLIEELLASTHPFERHTACLAINQFEQWQLRFSKGWLSGRSINPEHFTQTMFDRLIAMVGNPDEAVWLVDQSLLALAAAKPEQTMSHLDTILPWLEYDEWWFLESTTIALSPALRDAGGARKVLPAIATAHGKCDRSRGRSTVEQLISMNAKHMPDEARAFASTMFKKAYAETPKQSWEEGSMDLSAITSVTLAGTINTILTLDPALAPAMAELSAARLADLQPRERGMHIDALITAAAKLDAPARKQVGDILTRHFRSSIYQENAAVLSPGHKGGVKSLITPLNTILQIDQLSNPTAGWKLLDPKSEGTWQVATYDPAQKPDADVMERYRPVELPKHFENWFAPDYRASSDHWTTVSAPITGLAPTEYRNQPFWKTHAKQDGEVILLRKTVDIKDLDQALFRLVAYNRQGYRIYINGELVVETKGRTKTWQPRIEYGDANSKLRKALKPGSNTIAATSFRQYFRGPEGDLEVYLEGLKELPKPN
jgi:hypothetical protein